MFSYIDIHIRHHRYTTFEMANSDFLSGRENEVSPFYEDTTLPAATSPIVDADAEEIVNISKFHKTKQKNVSTPIDKW